MQKDLMQLNAGSQNFVSIPFGENLAENRTQTKLISDPQELYRFLDAPRVEVMNLMFAKDSVVWASWR